MRALPSCLTKLPCLPPFYQESIVKPSTSTIEYVIPDTLSGYRLDQALAALSKQYSRSSLQQWIRAGRVEVDGHFPKIHHKVLGGEWVVIRPEAIAKLESEPQDIDLNVLHRDDHLLVIDKPAGLVMHPAAGHRDGTVQNGLLYLDPELIHLPRAGIVHRLDKDTTGLFVVARTLLAYHSLVSQIQARSVHREYRAIANGLLLAGGHVDAPIARHPKDRTRMAVVEGGKYALTHYRVLERFAAHTYLKLQLETGRTHQIRVHMAYRKHPLVGDSLYAGRLRIPAKASPALAEGLRCFPRQALHAHRLCLQHPKSGEKMEWQSPLPEDLRGLLDTLRDNSATEAQTQ